MEKVIKYALEDIGSDRAFILTIEELAELQQAVAFILISSYDYDNLCEEIADVMLHIKLVRESMNISKRSIKKFKDYHHISFQCYVEDLSKQKLCLSAIAAMAALQQALTKEIRGKGKKGMVGKIVYVEWYLEELQSRQHVKEKDVSTWNKKKIKRLGNRVKKHTIF